MRGKYLILNFILLIVGIGAIILFAIKWANEQKIESVSVVGNELVPHNDLLSEVSDTLLNKSNSIIKLKNVEKLLKQNPYIQESYITHKNLNEISVEIKERIPVAALVLENGNLAFIDGEINILPYKLYNNMPDVPIIRGVFLNGRIDSTGILGCLVLLSKLNTDELSYLNTLISEIDYNINTKNFNLIGSETGAIIKLGSIKDLELKINKLDSYWKDALVSSEDKPIYIDLRWANHIISANS